MQRLILALIFALALILRLYHLNLVPPSLYWDEVSLGYNAFTISETAKDEHGRFMPHDYFAAFGDYKPPVYIYAVVPFIKLFGPTELAIRFPSALAGSLLVLVTFFLATRLSLSRKTGLVAALFVAISPWSLQMSRVAFEANLATLLSACGVLFFLTAAKQKNLFPLVLSSVFFALCFYTFNSHRIFVPILIAGLCLIYWRELLASWKKWIVFFALTGLLTLPILPHMLSADGRLRFNEVTWLKNLDIIVESNKKIEEFGGGPVAKVIFNRRVFYAREFASHYLDHFSPEFLFIKGDVNPRLSIQSVGELYLVDTIFVFTGLFFLLKFRSKATWVLLFWLIIAPIPASFARETPHALRILNMVPVPQMIAAIGLVYLARKLKLLALIVPVLYFISLYHYIFNYHTVYPQAFTYDWQYGYKQMVQEVSKLEKNYDKINVTSKYGRPYIYFLFYNQVPLSSYLLTRNAYKDEFGFWQVDGFGNYSFIEQKSPKKDTLYVRLSEDFPNLKREKTVYDLTGKPIFVITPNL